IERQLNNARPECEDGNIVISEIKNSIQLIRHGIHLGQLKLILAGKNIENREIKLVLLELIDEISDIATRHMELWLKRNRIGGLMLSVGRMESLKAEYFRFLR